MKLKLFISTLIIFNLNFLIAQEDNTLLPRLESLVIKNDSIKKINKDLYDSILSLNIYIKTKNIQFDTLQTKYLDSQKKLKQLESKDWKKMEQQVLQNKDSVLFYKKKILKKNNKIKILEAKIEKLEKEKIKLKQNIYEQRFITKYSAQNFDSFISKSSEQIVEEDVQFSLDNNSSAKITLQDLSSFFAAKKVLIEKYDEQEVEKALELFDFIKITSPKVEELQKTIDEYELYNDALKETISKIIKIDQEQEAVNEKSQESKLADILSELAWFFRNYEFKSHSDFNKYPYLWDIIIEIMNIKQKDANTDISHLLQKL